MEKVEHAIQMPSSMVTTGEAASLGADGATTVQVQDAPLEVLYQHGGEWVRMTNSLNWAIGTLFVPASFLMLGYTATNNGLSSATKVLSAIGSLTLFFSWVYISRLYGESSSVARAVLMRVEASWKLPRELSLYTLQDPVVKRGPRGVNIRAFQYILLGILAISWLVVLFVDKFKVGP
jgi:hypothetical protein